MGKVMYVPNWLYEEIKREAKEGKTYAQVMVEWRGRGKVLEKKEKELEKKEKELQRKEEELRKMEVRLKEKEVSLKTMEIALERKKAEIQNKLQQLKTYKEMEGIDAIVKRLFNLPY